MARSDMTVELTLTDAAKMLIAEAREQLELNDKERAVIEAARSGDAQAIADAVKQLDEVENERE